MRVVLDTSVLVGAAPDLPEAEFAVARSGRQVRGRQVDLMIAATAHAHGAAVLARNPADLQGTEDLLTVLGA